MGDPDIVAEFEALAARFPNRVCLLVGYSPPATYQINAAADLMVVPSHFEPCGQTDLIAPLMGAVPIVSSVGGLVKSADPTRGFSYLGGPDELLDKLHEAVALYRSPATDRLREMRISAARYVLENLTWERVLERGYLPLYREALRRAAPETPALLP